MIELIVLQAVRLKGQVSPADLVATLNEHEADITSTVQQLVGAGLLVESTTLRISISGRDRLSALLAEERKGTDSITLAAVYDQFLSVNDDFKHLVTDWQLKDGTPNSHGDVEYDAAVLARLDDVHQQVMPVIAAAVTQLPRLRTYSSKLCVARDKVKAGEIAWLTRPLIDSYHTVWFELHEELILAVGLTRAEAARSGDAD